MATLPSPAQLVEAAKKNAAAVGKIIKENPQQSGAATTVASPQGSQYQTGVKP